MEVNVEQREEGEESEEEEEEEEDGVIVNIDGHEQQQFVEEFDIEAGME